MMCNWHQRSVQRLLCLGVSLLVFLLVGRAQDTGNTTIKNSGNYYWGEAVAESETEATDRAVTQLTQQIAVNVSSSFEHKIKETGTEVQSTVQSIVKSYSLATLKNLNRQKSQTPQGIQVLCYIDRQEVKRIFESRVRTVESIYDVAVKLQEEQNDFGQAVKFLYFATILMRSIPDQVINYDGKNLVVEIPRRIDDILTNTRLVLKSDKKIADNERELRFAVSAFGKPAATLEFAFWDGTDQRSAQAVDGEAVVTLFGASVGFDKLDVNIKYAYYEARDEIKEVGELWGVVSPANFKNAKRIPLSMAASEPAPPALSGSIALNMSESCEVADPIQRETLALLGLIKKNDIAGIRARYGSDQFLCDRIVNVIAHNHPTVDEDDFHGEINKTFTGWEVRHIRLLTSYPSLKKQGIEQLVLDFTKDGKLEDVNFGLMENLYEKFVREGKEAGDWQNRQVIVKFMERYRTAFLTRNIAMLDSMFAEEAVIIVGRVIHKTASKDVPAYSRLGGAPDYTTMRYTKEEYLRNQKKTFDTQKDIQLSFSTFSILRKNKQPGVYGISLRQSYNSTTYSDEGYLFLFIDFNDSLPQIYVRAWQPQEWDEESLVTLANFNLNK